MKIINQEHVGVGLYRNLTIIHAEDNYSPKQRSVNTHKLFTMPPILLRV